MEEHFQTIRFKIPVPPTGKSISAEVYEPPEPKAVVTLAHGAGTNMDHSFLKELASALAHQGLCTVRFNFFYTESGKKMPDRFPAASSVITALFNEIRTRYPNQPIFGGGKSFGGRMTSLTLAHTPDQSIAGLVFYGFPLHAAGNPGIERSEHLHAITDTPMLFLQGTKDTLARTDLITEVTSGLSLATLIKVEGADHSFKIGKQTGIQGLAEQTVNWIKKYA